MVEYLIGSTRSTAARREIRMHSASLHVPALCDIEVASALRRLLLRGTLSEKRTRQALADYLDLPVTRHGHQQLLARMLSLRTNFSAYDATYVALAERLGARLVTGDEVLARAARDHSEIPLVLV